MRSEETRPSPVATARREGCPNLNRLLTCLWIGTSYNCPRSMCDMQKETQPRHGRENR